jgi:CTP-dependent riboflavin kinase
MGSSCPKGLQGKVVSGLREGRFFTMLPWAREQFVSKLGIDPYPGTLNLKLDNVETLKEWERLKTLRGITIISPEGENSCNAKCFKILIQEKVSGAIVFPEVPSYPSDKLEIIADCNLKETLGIENGEIIQVDIVH